MPESTFDKYDFLAILGALAWLPSLISLIKYIFEKPKITLNVDRALEIGFTTNGPIINMHLALLAQKSNCLVNDIGIEIIHQNNDTTKFRWDWFEEQLSITDYPQAITPTRKNQRAVAIHIQKDQMIEKKIGFHHNAYKEALQDHEQATLEELSNILNASAAITDIKSRKPYNDLQNHIKTAFIWKPGEYAGRITVSTNEGVSSRLNFRFRLNTVQVKLLQDNLPTIASYIENRYTDVEETEVREWNWVNPILTIV